MVPMTIDDGRISGRLAELRERVYALGQQAVVLCSAPRRLGAGVQNLGNTRYFLGYTPMSGHVVLVVPVEGDAVAFAAGPNERRVLAQRVGETVTVLAASSDALGAAVAGGLAERGIRSSRPIGIAGLRDLSQRAADGLCQALPAAVSIDPEIARMRSVGDAVDVALHRRAAAISDAMIESTFSLAMEPGMTPARLMAEVERTGRALGADAASLWLAVGAAPPVTCFEFFELPETIDPGDRIQLGTNVSFEGHFAQGLRMAVRGEPSAELQALSQRLLDMQDAAFATLRVGAPVHTLGDTLERMIDQTCPFTADTDPFRFQSCHQLGLDYSEPWLATALDRRRDRAGDRDGPVFREGMVFEIHPNFTVPGLGHVCQGDMAMVTAAGAEWITTYPRGLVVLPG